MISLTTISPAAETSSEVEGLLRDVVYRHKRKFGGDIEELMCEVNVAFQKAYNAFDTSGGG